MSDAITDDQKAELILNWIFSYRRLEFNIAKYTVMLKKFCKMLNLFIKGQDRITRIFKEGCIAVVENDGFLNGPHLYVVNGDSRLRISKFPRLTVSGGDDVYFINFDKKDLVQIYENIRVAIDRRDDEINLVLLKENRQLEYCVELDEYYIAEIIDTLNSYVRGYYNLERFDSIEIQSGNSLDIFELAYYVSRYVPDEDLFFDLIFKTQESPYRYGALFYEFNSVREWINKLNEIVLRVIFLNKTALLEVTYSKLSAFSDAFTKDEIDDEQYAEIGNIIDSHTIVLKLLFQIFANPNLTRKKINSSYFHTAHLHFFSKAIKGTPFKISPIIIISESKG